MESLWLKTFIRLLIFLLLILFILSSAIGLLVKKSGVVLDDIDIHTPAALEAKLDILASFEGAKIVVLGDSVALGKAMGEYGDHQWRQHTLSSILAGYWQEQYPDKPVMSLNLALNGAVPADLEKMVELLEGISIDLLVLDIAMRSFSADFSLPDDLYSRVWLPNLQSNGKGNLNFDVTGSIFERYDNALSNFASNFFTAFFLRDIIRERLFDGDSRTIISRALHKFFMTEADKISSDDELFLLLLRTRNRLATVNFDEGNPQRRALERMMSLLVERKQKTIIFYAKENPMLIESLLDPKIHSQWLDSFAQFMARYTDDGTIFYIPPLKELSENYYLDTAHVNAAGYQIISEAIWQCAGL